MISGCSYSGCIDVIVVQYRLYRFRYVFRGMTLSSEMTNRQTLMLQLKEIVYPKRVDIKIRLVINPIWPGGGGVDSTHSKLKLL